MICKEIMKRYTEEVRPWDNLHSAARKMRDRGVGFLPVVDEQGRPIGTLTDRDIVVRCLAKDMRPSNATAREVMSTELVTCGRWDDLRVAEELMARHHKSRILCVDEKGVLAGIISLSDIAEKEEGAQAVRLMRAVSHREGSPAGM